MNGIRFFSSNNNTISNNSAISNLDNGIYIFASNGNQIISNNLSSNDGAGILLNFTSNNNNILFNDIFSNNEYGINILESFQNKIFYNNIISNPNQAGESGVGDNQWDDGDSEGNYWSDYSGLDNGADSRIAVDGIGDTDLKHLGLDNYPFMNRSGWLAPGIPRLIGPDDFDSDGKYTISWMLNRGTIKYELEEDDDINFATPEVVYSGAALSWQAENRKNGTYYYRVKAFTDDYESVWSKTKHIVVDWPPNIPMNFNITPYPEGNALNLNWDLNLIDTKEYDLYIKNESTSAWEILSTIVHPNNKFDHKQLQDGKEYFYRLKARDARDRESNFTEIISAQPKDSVAPKSPTNLTVSEVNFDTIELRWEANAENDVNGYAIFIDNISNPTNPWDQVGVVNAEFTEFLVTGLEELTKYHFVIIAFDEVPNNSSYSNVASGTTVLGPHAPEINNSMVDFSINEDTIDDVRINLFRWFKDINHDQLTFRCTGQMHINITIFQNNGTVIIKPEKNWFGMETLTFYANDSIFEIYANVTIKVKSVNDAPGPVEILNPQDGYEVNESVEINFEGLCDDPDIPFGDNLTYKWTSSISGEVGFGQDISVKLPPGEHIITLEVSDNASESASKSITISVIGQKKSSDNGDNFGLILGGILGVIIVIIIVLALFIIKKKRKEKESDKLMATDMDAEGAEAMVTGVLTTPTTTAVTASTTSEPKVEPQLQPQLHPYLAPSSQIEIPPAAPYDAAMATYGSSAAEAVENIDWGRA
jgi:parallel beta-helix repeat protein